MEDVVKTLTVDTLTLEDPEIAIKINDRYKHNIQQQFNVILRLNGLTKWVISGEVQNTLAAINEIKNCANQLNDLD